MESHRQYAMQHNVRMFAACAHAKSGYGFANETFLIEFN